MKPVSKTSAWSRVAVPLCAVALVLAWSGMATACPVCYGEAQGPLIDAARVGAWMLIGVIASMWIGFTWFFVYLWRRAKQFREDPPMGSAASPCECCP